MYISAMFKDKNKVFKGKAYDFELHPSETVPPVGSIVRLMDEDYEYLYYGTRMKVVGVKKESSVVTSTKIRYLLTTLDD